jgi:hypothetical protein
MLTGRILNRAFLQFDCDIHSVYADIVSGHAMLALMVYAETLLPAFAT